MFQFSAIQIGLWPDPLFQYCEVYRVEQTVTAASIAFYLPPLLAFRQVGDYSKQHKENPRKARLAAYRVSIWDIHYTAPDPVCSLSEQSADYAITYLNSQARPDQLGTREQPGTLQGI